MTKEEKQSYVDRHSYKKDSYFMLSKRIAMYEEAIVKWSNSHELDNVKQRHIERLTSKCDVITFELNKVKQQIEDLESFMKSKHINFEPLVKKL